MSKDAVGVILHHLRDCQRSIEELQDAKGPPVVNETFETWEQLYKKDPTIVEIKFMEEVDYILTLSREMRKFIGKADSHGDQADVLMHLSSLDNIIRDLQIHIIGGRIERQNAYLQWSFRMDEWPEYEDWPTWRRKFTEKFGFQTETADYDWTAVEEVKKFKSLLTDPAADIKRVADLRDVIIIKTGEFQRLKNNPTACVNKLADLQMDIITLTIELAKAQETHERSLWKGIESRRRVWLYQHKPRKPFADEAHNVWRAAAAEPNGSIEKMKLRRRWARLVTWLVPNPVAEPLSTNGWSDVLLLDVLGLNERKAKCKTCRKCGTKPLVTTEEQEKNVALLMRKISNLERRVSTNVDRHDIEVRLLARDMAYQLIELLEEYLEVRREIREEEKRIDERVKRQVMKDRNTATINEKRRRAEETRIKMEIENEQIRQIQERRARHRQQLCARAGHCMHPVAGAPAAAGAATGDAPPAAEPDEDSDWGGRHPSELIAERILKLSPTRSTGEGEGEEEDIDPELYEPSPPPPLPQTSRHSRSEAAAASRLEPIQERPEGKNGTGEKFGKGKARKRNKKVKKREAAAQQQVIKETEFCDATSPRNHNKPPPKISDDTYRMYVRRMANKIKFRDSKEKPQYSWMRHNGFAIVLDNIPENEYDDYSDDGDGDDGIPDDLPDLVTPPPPMIPEEAERGDGAESDAETVKQDDDEYEYQEYQPQNSDDSLAGDDQEPVSRRPKSKNRKKKNKNRPSLTGPQQRAESRFRALLQKQRAQMLKLVDDLAKERKYSQMNGRLTQQERRQIQIQNQEYNSAVLRKLLEEQRTQQLELVELLLFEERQKLHDEMGVDVRAPADGSSGESAAPGVEEQDALERRWLLRMLQDILVELQMSPTGLKAKSTPAAPTPLNTTTIMGGRKVTVSMNMDLGKSQTEPEELPVPAHAPTERSSCLVL